MSELKRLTDDALILRIKDERSEKAVKAAENELLERHYEAGIRQAMYLMKDKDKATHLFHDSWFKFLESVDRYRPGNFMGYLVTIMRNKAKDTWRKEARDKEVVVSGMTDDEDDNYFDGVADVNSKTPFILLQLKECIEALRSIVPELPFEQVEALVLKVFHGMSYSEIGVEQQVGLETVKARLRYARHTIKKRMPAECRKVSA